MSLLCLRPLTVALVGGGVSKPCRLESTARGLAGAISCAIGGKENVRGSNSTPVGQHLANRYISCRSVLLAARTQRKSSSQTRTQTARTESKMTNLGHQRLLPVEPSQSR